MSGRKGYCIPKRKIENKNTRKQACCLQLKVKNMAGCEVARKVGYRPGAGDLEGGLQKLDYITWAVEPQERF